MPDNGDYVKSGAGWGPVDVPDDTGWIALTLLNGWVNFDTAAGGLATAAYRRVNGVVYLRGTIKNGSLTSGTALFVLPEGFRPASMLRFMLLSNVAIAVAHLSNTGSIVFSGAAPSNASLSLDTIRFVAEQ